MLTVKKLTLIILIILISIFGASCNQEESLPTVEEVDLSEEATVVEAFGLVKADESKDIIIDFPATINEVFVKEGQHLGYQEAILTMNLSDYYNLISNKKNELNIARLEYQSANSSLGGLTIANVDIEMEKLDSDLEMAKTNYNQLLEDYNSNEMLYSLGGISLENLQQSKLALDEAGHNIEAIDYEKQLIASKYEEEVKKLGNQKSRESYQVSIQNERIKQIENELAILEAKASKPFIIGKQIVSEYENAAVYDIKYTPGSIVDSNTKAFTIVNLDSLIIEANVVEEFIRDVKIGSKVKIVPIADRAKGYIGKVIFISQIAFNNNGETEIPVRISIDNLDSFLLPNYNVDVFIDVEK